MSILTAPKVPAPAVFDRSPNRLAELIMQIAGKRLTIRHIPGPLGVRGRNSDNTLLRQVLGWEPQISLEEGLRRTYTWIEGNVVQQGVPVLSLAS